MANQHDENHISYSEVKRRAEELLREYPILTKDSIPYELCPYFTLRFAEKSASFCFAVVNFIDKVKPRALTILDEDPTLHHFYPPSVELCRCLKKKNEYKFDNTIGKALEQLNGVEEMLKNKERPREEDNVLIQSLGILGGIHETIKATMSGESTPNQCYEKINEQLASESEVSYEVRNKTLEKFDEYGPEREHGSRKKT